MELLILSCLPTKEPAILSLEKEYEKRLKPWITLKIIESAAVARAHSKSPRERWKIEDKQLLDLIKPGTVAVLLDEGGKQLSTKQISQQLQEWQLQGVKRIVLGVGAADGWPAEIKQQVKQSWALSKLTFPYQLARLILIEQLYRSFSILNNSPYHRGS